MLVQYFNKNTLLLLEIKEAYTTLYQTQDLFHMFKYQVLFRDESFLKPRRQRKIYENILIYGSSFSLLIK